MVPLRLDRRWALASALLPVLGGCGGGEDQAQEIRSASGLYKGNLAGLAITQFKLLILDNGAIYAFVGDESQPDTVGLISGQAVFDRGRIKSAVLTDHRFNGNGSGSGGGSYASFPPSVTLTIASAQGSYAFYGADVTESVFSYHAVPAVSAAAGVWNVRGSLGVVWANIAASGDVTLHTEFGGAIQGSIRPHGSGKNIFEFKVGIPRLGEAVATVETGIAFISTTVTGAAAIAIAVGNRWWTGFRS